MEEFAAELRAFDGRREVVNSIRRELREPLPELRKDFRANAKAILPGSGGLGAWVASARITVRFRDAGRSAGVSIKVSRKAGDGDKADLKALDDSGAIRHPLYGNRGHWYGQSVPAGVFTSVWDGTRWLERVDAAFDRALDEIRGG
jgi:hypothetical protein